MRPGAALVAGCGSVFVACSRRSTRRDGTRSARLREPAQFRRVLLVMGRTGVEPPLSEHWNTSRVRTKEPKGRADARRCPVEDSPETGAIGRPRRRRRARHREERHEWALRSAGSHGESWVGTGRRLTGCRTTRLMAGDATAAAIISPTEHAGLPSPGPPPRRRHWAAVRAQLPACRGEATRAMHAAI
jgi:hypothetical protein